MARKVEVQLLDDIDGTPADETVTFGLDGRVYEIDLSATRASKLRGDLDRYVHAARRVGRGNVTSRTGLPARTGRGDPAQNAAIREWARRKKIQLADRGRIPRKFVEQYHAEAGR
jgi:hypothetical protein